MTNWRQQTTLVRDARATGGSRGRGAVVVVALAAAGLIVSSSAAVAGTVVRFNTSLGAINVEMLDSLTPITVANFLTYVNAGDYTNTFIHRSAKTQTNQPFVIQGGGFSMNHFQTLPTATHITQRPPIQNEPHDLNLRGTIAMAKTSEPVSATSEFFFNLGDNSFLNAQAFTVFGRVLGDNMSVVDAIAALQRFNFSSHPAFSEVPVRNFTSGTPTNANAVVLNSVTVVPNPWHNPGNRLDVSNNNVVAPQDVLMVVNDLNANGIRGTIGLAVGAPYVDVNGNGRIEPVDVLSIINYLNAQPGGASGLSGEVPAMAAVPEPSGLALALAAVGVAAFGFRRRRRTNN